MPAKTKTRKTATSNSQTETEIELDRVLKRLERLRKAGVISVDDEIYYSQEAKFVMQCMTFVRRTYQHKLDVYMTERSKFLRCHADNRHDWSHMWLVPPSVRRMVGSRRGAVHFRIMECSRCESNRIEYRDANGSLVGDYRRIYAEGYMPEDLMPRKETPYKGVWQALRNYMLFNERLDELGEELRGARRRHPTGIVKLRAV